MRFLFAFPLTLFGVIVNTSALAAPTPHGSASLLSNTRPMVLAHRGCFESRPENSLTALKACIKLGVDMVEGDVRSTRDGVLVMLHDESLDRTTDVTGRLKDFTYLQLQGARLREGLGGSNAPISTNPVPRLVDMLRAAKGRIVLLLHVVEPLYNQIYDTVESERAQDRVALLIDAAPNDPRLRRTWSGGQWTYIPIIWRCGAEEHNACFHSLASAITAYGALHPLAYFPAGTANDLEFMTHGESGAPKTDVRLVGSSDEKSLEEDKHFVAPDPNAVWGNLLSLHTSIVLTEHPSELIDYLKSKRLR